MIRLLFGLLLVCTSLQVYGDVSGSILPLMDEVYSLDFGNRVNEKQKELMRRACDKQSVKIRVMSYNMLYNMKDAEEMLPAKYRWDHRKPRLVEYISFASPDIIGSQELQAEQVREVMEKWGTVYGCYGESTRESEGRADVNAIFFKKERFELIDSKTVPYNDRDYENAFTICSFKDKINKKEFVVINTKLTWGDADRRLAEAMQLNQFTSSFSREMPIMVLGDFNTFPCLNHKINIFLDGDYVEQVVEGKNLTEAKKKSIFGHFGPICSITNSKTTLAPFSGAELTGFILDHVFVNDCVDVFCHGIDTAKVDGEFPSDHFPVITDLFIHNEVNMTQSLKIQPRIGVGVLVLKDNKILLGERIYSHGSGTWCPPGGHLEFGESPEECAARELEEEAGLIAKKVDAGPWTNDFFEKEGKHYVTLYMIVPEFKGSLSVQEPDKCLRWEWFDFDKLPEPLFLSLSNLTKENSLEALLSEYLPTSF